MVKQLARGVEAARQCDQLLHVLQATFRRLRFAVAQHRAIAGRIQQQRELVREGRRAISGNPFDRVGEGATG